MPESRTLSLTSAVLTALGHPMVLSDPVPPDGAWVLTSISFRQAPTPATTIFVARRTSAGGRVIIDSFVLNNTGWLTYTLSQQLLAGDTIELTTGNFNAGDELDLSLVGYDDLLQVIPPPPPLGSWCEPFIPTDADTADQIYTAHLDRMQQLSETF
jgi:hypothetical protein